MTDTIKVRAPGGFVLSTLVAAAASAWFGLSAVADMQSGATLDVVEALLGLAAPCFLGLFLYEAGLVVEVDERQVVARWFGRSFKEFETRSLQRVEVVVNAWRLEFEGGGTILLINNFDGASSAVALLSMLLEARGRRRARSSTVAAPRSKPARTRPGRSRRPMPRQLVSLPLLHVRFPDECVACGGHVALEASLEIEHETLLQRLSGTYARAAVKVPCCARCGGRHRRNGVVPLAVGVLAVAQLGTSIAWETHPIVAAVAMALPLLWLANSHLVTRWLTRAALCVEVVKLDPETEELTLRFVDPHRARQVAALTEAAREANLEAADELLESSVG